MKYLLAISLAIDAFNNKTGKIVAWLAIGMVLLQFAIVIMRYVFGVGSILMQEGVYYMHGTLFMLGAGYTLLHDGHVRVDIFYRDATSRTKAIVNLVGSGCLLIPVTILLFWASEPYVQQSWSIGEGSKETSGIQAVFVLKSAILWFCVFVFMQGVSLALRSVLDILGARHGPVSSDDIKV